MKIELVSTKSWKLSSVLNRCILEVFNREWASDTEHAKNKNKTKNTCPSKDLYVTLKWNYGASPVNSFTSQKICSNRRSGKIRLQICLQKFTVK